MHVTLDLYSRFTVANDANQIKAESMDIWKCQMLTAGVNKTTVRPLAEKSSSEKPLERKCLTKGSDSPAY